jgi:benzoate/toluate 1,2-dioxygenase reductase component
VATAGHLTDVEAYVRANVAFHDHLVGLAGSAALSHAYEQLSVREFMTRALSTTTGVDGGIAADHVEIVDAYDRADLAAAREVIVRHAAHAKTAQRAGIEDAGGRL